MRLNTLYNTPTCVFSKQTETMAAQLVETPGNEGTPSNEERKETKVINKEDDNEVNTIDLAKEEDYPWWGYTFNVKNIYLIHIEFKAIGGSSWNAYANWNKYGARNCYINSKPAKILSIYDPRNDDNSSKLPFDSNEVIKIQQNNKIYKLFYLYKTAWCFDNGDGIFVNVQRTNNGQIKTIK